MTDIYNIKCELKKGSTPEELIATFQKQLDTAKKEIKKEKEEQEKKNKELEKKAHEKELTKSRERLANALIEWGIASGLIDYKDCATSEILSIEHEIFDQITSTLHIIEKSGTMQNVFRRNYIDKWSTDEGIINFFLKSL